MIVVLFTLVSAGGYFFLHFCNITKYRSYRASSRRIYLNSVIIGFLSFNFCLGIYFLDLYYNQNILLVDSISKVFSVYIDKDSIKIPIISSLSILLCFLVAFIINTVQLVWYRVKVDMRAIEINIPLLPKQNLEEARYAIATKLLEENEFEVLALESWYREKPVSVTLSNGKVYIGFIKRQPNITQAREYLNLLPLASGYRDDKQNLVLVTDYIELIDRYIEKVEKYFLTDDDFDLVIKYENIITINLFSPEIYEAQLDSVNEQEQV